MTPIVSRIFFYRTIFFWSVKKKGSNYNLSCLLIFCLFCFSVSSFLECFTSFGLRFCCNWGKKPSNRVSLISRGKPITMDLNRPCVWWPLELKSEKDVFAACPQGRGRSFCIAHSWNRACKPRLMPSLQTKAHDSFVTQSRRLGLIEAASSRELHRGVGFPVYKASTGRVLTDWKWKLPLFSWPSQTQNIVLSLSLSPSLSLSLSLSRARALYHTACIYVSHTFHFEYLYQ